MLNLETKIRDEIVRVLQTQLAPASTGAVLMQIAQILANLKEEPKKENAESTNI